ncbi:MAG: hypothetical protein MJ107_03555 [Lachnospiraceae bacterium]|nr:hypothetical protein [Lachnospiraceae bacterium]
MKNSVDMSALFGSLNNKNNAFSGINLMDYSSIKNGSYGKLMKAYYSKDAAGDSDKSQAVNKIVDKKAQVDTTGLSDVKKKADALKASADKLASSDLWATVDGSYDTDKVASAVEDFAKNYNSTLKQAAKVTSTDISKNASYMEDMSKMMSKTLAKAGITFDTDGYMKVDTDALKKADQKVVKSLFEGSASYGSEIASNAADIAKTAVNNSSLYNNQAALNSSMPGIFNSFV